MNLDRKTLFEEMNKIGMFEEDEYISEDFESICEDLANLIWFVDTLFSENDLETIRKLLPNEYKQCWFIWGRVYKEYQRLNYRLDKIEDLEEVIDFCNKFDLIDFLECIATLQI